MTILNYFCTIRIHRRGEGCHDVYYVLYIEYIIKVWCYAYGSVLSVVLVQTEPVVLVHSLQSLCRALSSCAEPLVLAQSLRFL